ncbi:alpha/beta fold hydrolase [Belnapia mucosa]|uniref:alpha/beta fold hydrolase n=1 Tax=Belnapia mucosa TaxID=2804532 RepID=UPI002E29F606|nr:alpha/beta hydrolase [Belnapia mucosa]
MAKAADHWVETPGGRLFARSWQPEGSAAEAGPTVVLIHDSLGCVELWRDFPAALATALGRRVVAYDRLGFGRSDPHPGPLPPDFIRGETEAGLLPLCEQLGIGRMVPFGHSVGGGMAVGAAARLPERCAALVTVSAQTFVEDRTLAGLREAEAGFRDPAQMQRLARYHGAKAEWVLEAWLGTWLAPEFAGWTLDADLARVRCPLLALHGDRDEYGSARHPERIVAGAAGPSRMVLLPGCGHVPHREGPEAVIEEVARFLAQPSTRRSSA